MGRFAQPGSRAAAATPAGCRCPPRRAGRSGCDPPAAAAGNSGYRAAMRQLQLARQPPEPEHEVGFGLALSAHEATAASPSWAHRHRRERPRSRRPARSPRPPPGCARTRCPGRPSSTKCMAIGSFAAACSHTLRACPSGRLSTTMSVDLVGRQARRTRSARWHEAPAPAGRRDRRCRWTRPAGAWLTRRRTFG